MCGSFGVNTVKIIISTVTITVGSFSFIMPMWVSNDRAYWGLWFWCPNGEGNETTQGDDNTCHAIWPGESPPYFEWVRFLAAVTYFFYMLSVVMISNTIVIGDKHYPGCPILLTFIPPLTAGITLVVLGLYNQDDERWKNSNPSLNYSVWLFALPAVITFPLSCFLCRQWINELEKRNPQSVCTLRSQGVAFTVPAPFFTDDKKQITISCTGQGM